MQYLNSDLTDCNTASRCDRGQQPAKTGQTESAKSAVAVSSPGQPDGVGVVVNPDDTLIHDQWIERLEQMRRRELKTLFKSLPSPAVEELHGEYQGILLDQGNRLVTGILRRLINYNGVWLGKAFEPLDEKSGRGYNLFRTSDGICRRLRMDAYAKQDDDGEHFVIDYTTRHTGLIGRMTDELRRVAPGVFLGLGTVNAGGKLLPNFKSRVLFALVGPVAEFQAEAATRDTVTPVGRIVGRFAA